jgi:hypothetical protein
MPGQIGILLNHVNPDTGLAYKDDPALAYVECINEQTVLCYSNTPVIAKKPTYKRLMAERFSDWLKQKYEGTLSDLARPSGLPASVCRTEAVSLWSIAG